MIAKFVRFISSTIRRRRAFYRGWIEYAGAKVYLPKSGTWAAESILYHGTYEAELSAACLRAAVDGTTVFDVGGNIGVSAVPLLAALPTLRVVSVEPSPNTLPYLLRTRAESAYAGRWEVVDKAAASSAGEVVEFHCFDDGLNAFDGIRNTNRVGTTGRRVDVGTTTIDAEWDARNRPPVSLVKIDVEGAEPLVLRGAEDVIRLCRPVVVTEWSLKNIVAYKTAPEWIFDFASDNGYRIHTLPGLVPVDDRVVFPYHLTEVENLLMLPIPSASLAPRT